MNTVKINGRSVCYSDTTVFQVQVGRGKGSYKDKYTFTGDIRKAAFYYECINIGNGYKKRLCMNGKAIVRAFS